MTSINLRTAFLFATALLTGCNAALKFTAPPAEQSAASVGQGEINIENGKNVTEDPILSLSLSTPSPAFTKMKISLQSGCVGGEWQNFDSPINVMSPKVNEAVVISAQFMTDDGLVSDCVSDEIVHDNPNTPEVCEDTPTVCDREPEVQTPGVVTVLLALGDTLNQQLIVNGSSAAVIAETAIRFASPAREPRILVVRDMANMGESFGDTEYIAHDLLRLYESVTLIDEPAGGLLPTDLLGYDLVWFNNPGYPMGSQVSFNTLMGFRGGIVLSGDDMTWGKNVSTEGLTGLRHIDNGTEVVCGGVSYNHNDNSGLQYSVALEPSALPLFPPDILNFKYGNDIDNSVVANQRVKVLAWAVGGDASCTEKRPVIARYKKDL